MEVLFHTIVNVYYKKKKGILQGKNKFFSQEYIYAIYGNKYMDYPT